MNKPEERFKIFDENSKEIASFDDDRAARMFLRNECSRDCQVHKIDRKGETKAVYSAMYFMSH